MSSLQTAEVIVRPPSVATNPVQKANEDTQALKEAIVQGMGNAIIRLHPSSRYIHDNDPHHYHINDTLILNNQALVGMDNLNWGAQKSIAPCLRFVGFARDNRNPACIMLDNGGFVHGIHIRCDNDVRELGKAAIATSATSSNADGSRVSDMYIRNAAIGISCGGGRGLVQNVFMEDIKETGVVVSSSRDYCWINRVEVWGTKAGLEVPVYTDRGFWFSGLDYCFISDCAAFGCATGFMFVEEPTVGTLTNCQTDFCINGIKINDGRNAGHHINITGGLYVNHEGGILIDSGYSTVNISSTKIHTNASPTIRINSASAVNVSSSQLNRFFSGSTPVVEVGSNCKTFAITSSMIQHHQTNENPISIASGVRYVKEANFVGALE